MHLGFIGTDWNAHMNGPLGPLLMPLTRGADFCTATGERMRREMLAAGFDEKRVTVLPHGIDLDRHPVGNPGGARYACIFVGGLTRLKRVDLVLEAFAKVLASRPEAKLCIVGDGPQRGRLAALADTLGIGASVDFVGHTDNVASYLGQARIQLLASRREGFPFSLVEGMCCGLVPVSTPVGDIPDHVRDGENGLLFPVGDAAALSACILRLLEDRAVYERLRGNVLRGREAFSYDRATAVWDPWIRSLSAPGPARATASDSPSSV
jgi:glycosyltransferase involved in cell wall biosynthesis